MKFFRIEFNSYFIYILVIFSKIIFIFLVKSLNKAKNLLLQGEKLRNPFNMADNIDMDENNDNLLFKEEKTAFSLKKILRDKIKEGIF